MILAIESATPSGSLALYDRDSGTVAWRHDFTSDRAHNAVIFEPLAEALDRSGRELELIAVGRGPGSYGGIRVGIAVANGLSIALGTRVIGLSSLDALDTDADRYAVIGDARRKSFFVAEVSERTLEGEPDLVTEEGLVEALTLFGERGVPVFSSDATVVAGFESVNEARPAAHRLAERAARLSPEEIEALVTTPLEPHYLRAPYITTPRG